MDKAQVNWMRVILSPLGCCLLLLVVVGCAGNRAELAENQEDPSEKVADDGESKRGFFSRLASLRKRESTEESPLVRDASEGTDPFLKNELRTGQRSQPSGSQQQQSQEKPQEKPQQNVSPQKRFDDLIARYSTEPSSTDTTKMGASQKGAGEFMSIDQFMASVNQLPQSAVPSSSSTAANSTAANSTAAKTETNNAKVAAVSPPSQKNLFQPFESHFKTETKTTETKAEGTASDLNAVAATKSSSSEAWDANSEAIPWKANGSSSPAIAPAFANFVVSPSAKNPVIEPVIKTVTKTKPLIASKVQPKIDPAFAHFQLKSVEEAVKDSAEKKPSLTALGKLLAKTPELKSKTDLSDKSALEKLRANLGEKSLSDSNKKENKADVVSQVSPHVRSSVQSLLATSSTLLKAGHLASAKQLAVEADGLAERTKLVFESKEQRPKDILKQIEEKITAKKSGEEKSVIASRRSPDALPLIVSSPLKEYRAAAGSGFHVAMVKANGPVSLASFITDVSDDEPTDATSNNKKEEAKTTRSPSLSSVNRELILKPASGKKSELLVREPIKQKTFLPAKIQLTFPADDVAPLPTNGLSSLETGDATVVGIPSLPSVDQLIVPVSSEVRSSKLSTFRFPGSLFDGSRGPIMPMLATFLGAAFLITLLMWFRR